MVLIVLGRQSQNQRSIPGKGNAKREVKSDTKVIAIVSNDAKSAATAADSNFAEICRCRSRLFKTCLEAFKDIYEVPKKRETIKLYFEFSFDLDFCKNNILETVSLKYRYV